MPPRASMPRPRHPTSPFQGDPPPPAAEQYAADDRVTHDRYGLGRVLSTEGEAWVIVRFGTDVIRVANGPKLAKL